MTITVAYLGPPGTYSELAASTYRQYLQLCTQEDIHLKGYPSLFQVLQSTDCHQTQAAIVPVENSIEGGVSVVLDSLWQLRNLTIQSALVIPIVHALLSTASSLDNIQTIYSHPQALAQCQKWIESTLPQAMLIPTRSTTEALHHLKSSPKAAAIASTRAADLYKLPILADSINDHADNCTKFWILSTTADTKGHCTSLVFSLPANIPGALLQPLQIFADYSINLSRIESRPTKRSLGEYLFFMDLEADSHIPSMQEAIKRLRSCTEELRILGSYDYLKTPD